MKKGKKAQVWVETVIYTLIGLVIITILLSILKPAIDRKQDQILIESSVGMIENFENVIEEVTYYGVGNTRPVDMRITKGKLEIDGVNDEIRFLINTKYKYSQPDEVIERGSLKIQTIEKQESYDLTVTLSYKDKFNITWNNKDTINAFQRAPSPYTISVMNKGKTNNLIQIDFS